MQEHPAAERLRAGRRELERLIETRGEAAVAEETVSRMVENGDLAFVHRLLCGFAAQMSDAILSDVGARDVDVARGQLIAVREVWRELLRPLAKDRDPQEGPPEEPNPLAMLDEELPDPYHPLELA